MCQYSGKRTWKSIFQDVEERIHWNWLINTNKHLKHSKLCLKQYFLHFLWLVITLSFYIVLYILLPTPRLRSLRIRYTQLRAVGLERFLLNAGVSWGSKSKQRTPRLCLQDVQQDKPFKVKAVSFLIVFFCLISREIHQPGQQNVSEQNLLPEYVCLDPPSAIHVFVWTPANQLHLL